MLQQRKILFLKLNGGEKTTFEGKYHGTMVSIGARYGVANVGGMHLSGWFANFVKHMVNILLFNDDWKRLLYCPIY